jgi:hypothetical protein
VTKEKSTPPSAAAAAEVRAHDQVWAGWERPALPPRRRSGSDQPTSSLSWASIGTVQRRVAASNWLTIVEASFNLPFGYGIGVG